MTLGRQVMANQIRKHGNKGNMLENTLLYKNPQIREFSTDMTNKDRSMRVKTTGLAVRTVN